MPRRTGPAYGVFHRRRAADGAGDAGSLALGGFLDADDEQWCRLFDLNLFSAVWTTRAALPSLLDRSGTVSPGVVGSALWRGPDGIGARMAAAHGPGLEEFLSVLPEQAGMASPRIPELPGSPGPTRSPRSSPSWSPVPRPTSWDPTS